MNKKEEKTIKKINLILFLDETLVHIAKFCLFVFHIFIFLGYKSFLGLIQSQLF